MARKMAEEILDAEKRAQQIISDAENKARQIADDARQRANDEHARIIAEAEKNAAAIIDGARAESEQQKESALSDVRNIENELDKKYGDNLEKAVANAAGILFS